MEKTAFGARDRDKNMLLQLRKAGSCMIWQAERLCYTFMNDSVRGLWNIF